MAMMFSRARFKQPQQPGIAENPTGEPVSLTFRRQPRDPLERFVAREIGRRGALPHDQLVSLVTGWIAQEERSTGGALDLVAWGDDLWRDEALRAVARLERDLLESPAA